MNGIEPSRVQQIYVDYLIQLHELIRADQGDSDLADSLRDRMDFYWRRLNPEQIKHVKEISADLNRIATVPSNPSLPVARSTS